MIRRPSNLSRNSETSIRSATAATSCSTYRSIKSILPTSKAFSPRTACPLSASCSTRRSSSSISCSFRATPPCSISIAGARSRPTTRTPSPACINSGCKSSSRRADLARRRSSRAPGSRPPRVRAAPVKVRRHGLATIAVTPTRTGGEPRGGGADQRGRASHEPEHERGVTRAIDVALGLPGDFHHAAVGIGGREAGGGGDQADQIGAVVRLHALVTRGGQKDAGGLGADGGHVAGRTALAAKQAVEIESDDVLAGNRACLTGARAGEPRHGFDGGEGQQAGQQRGERPYDKSMHAVAKLGLLQRRI